MKNYQFSKSEKFSQKVDEQDYFQIEFENFVLNGFDERIIYVKIIPKKLGSYRLKKISFDILGFQNELDLYYF